MNFHDFLRISKVEQEELHSSIFCSFKQLTSLVGSPEIVSGEYFCCSFNFLASLNGSPKLINKEFKVFQNNLYSLDFLPLYFQRVTP